MPRFMSDAHLPIVAAASLVPLILGWIIYPRWICRGRRTSPPVGQGAFGRSVTCVLATRDEPDVVAARVRNLRDASYPANLIDVVVAVDYRSTFAPDAYAGVLDIASVVIRGDAPGGKAAAMNAGVRSARGEIVLLVDSRQVFEPDTISTLLAGFDTGKFAAVSGVVALEREDRVMRWYWGYEIGIRRGQAAHRSLVTTSGAITALRRDAWHPIPVGAICDDLFLTIGLAQRGLRVGLVEGAVAHDPRLLDRKDRFAKKVRTLTGLVQFIRWNPAALLPWRNPVWADFYAHKLLRLATPPLLAIATLATGAWLAQHASRSVAFLVAAITVALVIVALFRPSQTRRVLSSGLWAVSLLAAPLVALLNGAMGSWDVWQPHPSTARASEDHGASTGPATP